MKEVQGVKRRQHNKKSCEANMRLLKPWKECLTCPKVSLHVESLCMKEQRLTGTPQSDSRESLLSLSTITYSWCSNARRKRYQETERQTYTLHNRKGRETNVNSVVGLFEKTSGIFLVEAEGRTGEQRESLWQRWKRADAPLKGGVAFYLDFLVSDVCLFAPCFPTQDVSLFFSCLFLSVVSFGQVSLPFFLSLSLLYTHKVLYSPDGCTVWCVDDLHFPSFFHLSRGLHHSLDDLQVILHQRLRHEWRRWRRRRRTTTTIRERTWVDVWLLLHNNCRSLADDDEVLPYNLIFPFFCSVKTMT